MKFKKLSLLFFMVYAGINFSGDEASKFILLLPLKDVEGLVCSITDGCNGSEKFIEACGPLGSGVSFEDVELEDLLQPVLSKLDYAKYKVDNDQNESVYKCLQKEFEQLVEYISKEVITKKVITKEVITKDDEERIKLLCSALNEVLEKKLVVKKPKEKKEKTEVRKDQEKTAQLSHLNVKENEGIEGNPKIEANEVLVGQNSKGSIAENEVKNLEIKEGSKTEGEVKDPKIEKESANKGGEEDQDLKEESKTEGVEKYRVSIPKLNKREFPLSESLYFATGIGIMHGLKLGVKSSLIKEVIGQSLNGINPYTKFLGSYFYKHIMPSIHCVGNVITPSVAKEFFEKLNNTQKVCLLAGSGVVLYGMGSFLKSKNHDYEKRNNSQKALEGLSSLSKGFGFTLAGASLLNGNPDMQKTLVVTGLGVSALKAAYDGATFNW